MEGQEPPNVVAKVFFFYFKVSPKVKGPKVKPIPPVHTDPEGTPEQNDRLIISAQTKKLELLHEVLLACLHEFCHAAITVRSHFEWSNLTCTLIHACIYE